MQSQSTVPAKNNQNVIWRNEWGPTGVRWRHLYRRGVHSYLVSISTRCIRFQVLSGGVARLYNTFTTSPSLPYQQQNSSANFPIYLWKGIFDILKCDPPCAATDSSSSVPHRAPTPPCKLLLFAQTAPPSTLSVILRVSSKFLQSLFSSFESFSWRNKKST